MAWQETPSSGMKKKKIKEGDKMENEGEKRMEGRGSEKKRIKRERKEEVKGNDQQAR